MERSAELAISVQHGLLILYSVRKTRERVRDEIDASGSDGAQ